MYYKEFGKVLSNVYSPLSLPSDKVTNVALEMCVSNLYRDMQKVSEYLGTTLTFDLNYKYKFFTAQDIIDVFVSNGFKVILTVNSELQNKVRITVIWTNELSNHHFQK